MNKKEQYRMIADVFYPCIDEESVQEDISYLYDSGVRVVPEDYDFSVHKILKEFAEKIKLRFYYNFDELIPSIMSDEIDKILEEILEEDEEI